MLHTVSTSASQHAAQMNQKVFGALVVVVSTLSADREELFISDGCLVRTVYREEEKTLRYRGNSPSLAGM